MTSFLPKDKRLQIHRIFPAWAETSFCVKLETVSRDRWHQLKKKNWGYHRDTSRENTRSLWSCFGRDRQMSETRKPQLQVPHEIALIRRAVIFNSSLAVSYQEISEKGGRQRIHPTFPPVKRSLPPCVRSSQCATFYIRLVKPAGWFFTLTSDLCWWRTSSKNKHINLASVIERNKVFPGLFPILITYSQNIHQ